MEGVQLARWGAGNILVSGLLGAIAGAVWGLSRPSYVLVDDGGHPAVDLIASPDNVEFASFAGFVLLSVVLGCVVGLSSLSAHKVSPWRMIAVAVVALFGAWTLLVFGSATAAEGVPLLRPGVGWLVAPFIACLSYWLGLLARVETKPE